MCVQLLDRSYAHVDQHLHSLCNLYVPGLQKRDLPDLEKVVSSSTAEAVRKEVGSSLVHATEEDNCIVVETSGFLIHILASEFL